MPSNSNRVAQGPTARKRSGRWVFYFGGANLKATETALSKECKTLERREKQERDCDEFLSGLNGKTTRDLGKALSSNESQILRELAEGIREIGYGSIVLIVHAGRLVEVTKTVRIRGSRVSKQQDE